MADILKKTKKWLAKNAPKKLQPYFKPAKKLKPSKANDIEAEREEVLKEGRSYIKPLALNRKRALALSGAILAVLLAAALSVIGVLIYRYQSSSDLVYEVSLVVPYPAARVNGQFMGYDDYLFELRSLKHYYQSPVSASSGGRQPVDFSTAEGKEQFKQLQKVAFSEAKKKLIIKQLAKENGLKVSRDELKKAVDDYARNEGGEDKLAEAIKYFYNWRLSDFRRVLEIQLLQQKLPKSFSNEQKVIADKVLVKAKAGEDFAKLVKEFSSDTASKATKGDLGYVNQQTQFVQEFKDAALRLEPGQLSEVVETQFGYHIIKATGRNEKGEIRVSHILIAYKDVQPLIQERMDQAKTNSYIGVGSEATTQQ